MTVAEGVSDAANPDKRVGARDTSPEPDPADLAASCRSPGPGDAARAPTLLCVSPGPGDAARAGTLPYQPDQRQERCVTLPYEPPAPPALRPVQLTLVARLRRLAARFRPY